MTKIKLKNAEIQEILTDEISDYPKYTTQIINLANQNAQGTRPKVVGQLSDLIVEFEGKSLNEWKEWYLKKHPKAIENAVDKIFPMIERLKDAIQKIDKKMVEAWVTDLVILKTFTGLKFQEAILHKIAFIKGQNYRLATPKEESRGIDGFIGNTPVSIKPDTYKVKASLSETIEQHIIYYSKKKDGVTIKFNF
ncbi:MjaI family restriction endonuclease [Aequorivita todarodis]|uniref:MjaI family restriction endonuclease n=1 Tax=Aequorivita todarodis TaxID=2036821 RepID=UPI002350C3BC|nr:MjaI family restriction endonuclease [Aequorivita todarodis]MDC8000988.1 MjaI family restriction endonuclease [Aequorivita todarodis]